MTVIKKDGLFFNRKYFPLFWTQFFGALNDNLLKNAILVLITFKNLEVFGLGPEQMVPAAGAIFILSFFLFSASAGQIAEKYEKSNLVRKIKALEVIIMICATLGFYFELYGFLVICLFLMGLQSTLFGPLKYSLLPQILDKDELFTGNALVQSGTNLAILFGLILGGLLNPFWACTILLAFSLIGYFSSMAIVQAPANDPELKVDLNPFRPTWTIIKLLIPMKKVWHGLLMISWFWFLGASILNIMPMYAKDVIGGNNEVFTYLMTLFSLGVGIGSMLADRISRGRLELGLVPLGVFLMSIGLGDLYFVDYEKISSSLINVTAFLRTAGAFRISFDFLLFAIAGGLYIVPLYTLIQQQCPRKFQSRTIAANNILNSLFIIIASIFVMALTAKGISYPEILFIVGAINLVVGIIIFLNLSDYFLSLILFFVTHILYKLKIKNIEKIPKEGSGVILCNHVSFIDWLFIAAASRRPIRFVIDYNYYFKWPGHLLFKLGKCIPIATKAEDRKVLIQAFKEIYRELENGHLIGLFPEGFITSDGELREFQSGIERILATKNTPVIPMALQGLWGSFFSRYHGGKAFNCRPKFHQRREVTLVVGDPIQKAGITRTELFEVIKELRGEIK